MVNAELDSIFIIRLITPVAFVLFTVVFGINGFLDARRGEDPGSVRFRTVLGLGGLIALAVDLLLFWPLTGESLVFASYFGELSCWMIAALLLSATPYWVVTLFNPHWQVLDRLERALTSANKP